MARRIVSAELSDIWRENIAHSGQSPFKVDDQVEIDWKFRIGTDYATGELISDLPPYSVIFRRQTIGELTEQEDIVWVRKATDQDPEDGAVGRINEILYGEYGAKKHVVSGFKLELLTGVDARKLKSLNDYEAAKQNLVRYWWIIPILLGLIWWKF